VALDRHHGFVFGRRFELFSYSGFFVFRSLKGLSPNTISTKIPKFWLLLQEKTFPMLCMENIFSFRLAQNLGILVTKAYLTTAP